MIKILIAVLPVLGTFIITRIIGARSIRKAQLEILNYRKVMKENNIFIS